MENQLNLSKKKKLRINTKKNLFQSYSRLKVEGLNRDFLFKYADKKLIDTIEEWCKIIQQHLNQSNG